MDEVVESAAVGGWSEDGKVVEGCDDSHFRDDGESVEVICGENFKTLVSSLSLLLLLLLWVDA